VNREDIIGGDRRALVIDEACRRVIDRFPADNGIRVVCFFDEGPWINGCWLADPIREEFRRIVNGLA